MPAPAVHYEDTPTRDPTTTMRVGVEAAEDGEEAEDGELAEDGEVAEDAEVVEDGEVAVIDLQRPQRELHQPVWMNDFVVGPITWV